MWEALLYIHTREGTVARSALEAIIRSRLEAECFGTCGAHLETKKVGLQEGPKEDVLKVNGGQYNQGCLSKPSPPGLGRRLLSGDGV